MSEYQYYEFLALDRPLGPEQQAEMRALSSRAHITATHFSNEYEWGDFKGDPQLLMEQHYDAHLYFADWGSRRLMLRVPEQLLDLETVRQYCFGDSVTAWTSGGRLILDFSSEENGDEDAAEDDDEDADAEGSLAVIAGVRAELIAGDHRALYLAWLSALAAWELQDDDEQEYQQELEPPVPGGLGRLTGPQLALAGFLRIDAQLLAAAAQSDPAQHPAQSDPAETDADAPPLVDWIAALPTAEKDALLLRAAQGDAPHLGAELTSRYRAAHRSVSPAAAVERRSAAQLLDIAAGLRSRR